MDDEAAPPLDKVRPRTIKAISDDCWDAISTAARQEGLTIGQWLEKRVKEWIGEGSPTALAVVTPQSHQVANPGKPGLTGSDELAQLVQLAIQLGKVEDREASVLKEARSAVRDRLRAVRQTR